MRPTSEVGVIEEVGGGQMEILEQAEVHVVEARTDHLHYTLRAGFGGRHGWRSIEAQ